MVTGIRFFLLFFAVFYVGSGVIAASLIPDMLQSYKTEGASHFDAKAGEVFWHKTFSAPEKAKRLKGAKRC